MILFKPEHVLLILFGRKTQTRRLGKKRWNIGSVHACYTRPPFAEGGAEPFCKVRIVDVRHQVIGDMTQAEYAAEGYADPNGFKDVWCRVNGAYHSGEVVWVVEFEVVA